MKDVAENPDNENWKRARSVIEHENTLINHRVTWLLASQGFLLAGYTALITSWAKAELHMGRSLESTRVPSMSKMKARSGIRK